ncbi:HEAT repeat domain-containing protein [Gemmatimonas aurantiaca]|uniref:HEAT repeat domain-containing protein n=1 Tax=Gemmatimonas aurantiaca TaxID=173480 RepID=UPI00301B9C17
MPSLGYRRSTPSSSSAESGAFRVVPDGRAARGAVRALALLVDRIVTLGMAGAGDALERAAVRDALRSLAARIREGAMLCRIVDGQFVLAGEPVDPGLTRDDPLLASLLQRGIALGIGGITVRQGAAPGELFTLASMLASSPRSREAPPFSSDTPTTMSSITGTGGGSGLAGAESASRELLRSWSVLVTPADVASEYRLETPAEGIAAINATLPEGMTSSVAATALTRLTAAHGDDAANHAVDQLVQVLDDAEYRGDAHVVEGIARACVAQVHAVGTGGTRLALERLLRRLQHRRTLELIGERLPHVPDRLILLELFARAGEIAVEILVNQLMRVQDAPARRAYFDSIVSLDLGATLLFELVRDPRWYVVRNAVALLGEMGVEYADTAMLPLVTHEDDRIRIAVARALIRLGSAKALAGLHGLIDDRNAEVRRIAAASYGLTSSASGSVRPPAARLAMALERETDEDVALEMLASLGRLGSADAVQRLLRIALPPQQPQDGSERPAPRESYLRVAAIESLLRARGQAVVPALESLRNDPDPDVAAAVAAALATSARRPEGWG